MIFAPDDQLLLIAARQRALMQGGVARSNVKLLEDLVGPSLNRAFVKKDIAGERSYRRTIMNAQDRVFREGEIEQKSPAVTVFGDVRDTQLASQPRAYAVDILAGQHRFSADARHID